MQLVYRKLPCNWCAGFALLSVGLMYYELPRHFMVMYYELPRHFMVTYYELPRHFMVVMSYQSTLRQSR
jgi:hypothetical protein